MLRAGRRLQCFFTSGDRESATSHRERTRGFADSEGKPLPIPKHIASYRAAFLGRITSIWLFAQAQALTEARDEIPVELSSTRRLRISLAVSVAVGTTIADRPPHRSVLARLRIRLLRRMSGVKACVGIGVQNSGWRNPPVQDWGKTFP